MIMKDRSIPVLLVCILVVGLFIVVQETWRAQQPKREYHQSKVFDLYPQSLSSLTFKRGDSRIECIKENGIWMVGDPDKGMGRADEARIFELVSSLNSLGKGTTITEKELKLRGLGAAEYGFVPPVLEIIAVDNRGRRVWQIGRDAPTGLEVYVRDAGGKDIFTILRKLWDIVPATADDLRNRALFPGEAAAINRLEIRGATAGFVRLVKEASSGWRIQQPIEAKADPLEVTTYIENMRDMKIEDFIAENVSDLSAYGLQGETRQISLGYSDGSSKTLILGDPIPGRAGLYYARKADDTSVFAMKADILQFFDLPENPFRDARILTLDPSNITGVHIRHGDQQLIMSENDAGNWQVLSPAVWDADADAVYNLIDLWSKAVITAYDVDVPNSVPADWTLEFVSGRTSGSTNRIEVLASGDRKDGLLIRMNQSLSVCQINLPLVPGSIINPLVYKDRHVWTLKRQEIAKLILQRANQEKQVVERTEEGTFVAAENNGNDQVDALAIERMIGRLCNLKATEYLAYNPRDLDAYGLSKPAVELYVGLADANELGRVLLIGRESTEGFYSMIKGRDVVFYLDKSAVESLTANLVVKPDVAPQVGE